MKIRLFFIYRGHVPTVFHTFPFPGTKVSYAMTLRRLFDAYEYGEVRAYTYIHGVGAPEFNLARTSRVTDDALISDEEIEAFVDRYFLANAADADVKNYEMDELRETASNHFQMTGLMTPELQVALREDKSLIVAAEGLIKTYTATHLKLRDWFK